MQLWLAKVNLDLTDRSGLDDLAASGLVDRLSDYYAVLAKQDPENTLVAMAREQLARP
jgi:hypothetical protein